MIDKNKPTRIEFIIAILVSAFALLYIYTFLHEGGHAIVGIIYGGSIEKFIIGFDARVRIIGANFTTIGLSVKNIAGMLLPVLFYLVFVSFYNKHVKSLLYHCFYYLSSIGIIGSILAWVIIPIISLVQSPPKGDDVTKFLDSADINPLFVSGSAILLIIFLVIIMVKKEVFKEYITIIKNMNSQ